MKCCFFILQIFLVSSLGFTPLEASSAHKLICDWQYLSVPYQKKTRFYSACSLVATTPLSSGQYAITCNIIYQDTAVCNTSPRLPILTFDNALQQCSTSGKQFGHNCLIFSACGTKNKDCATAQITTPVTCQHFSVTRTYSTSWRVGGVFFYLSETPFPARPQQPPALYCFAKNIKK